MAVMITPGKQIPGVKIQVLAGAPSGDNSVSDLQQHHSTTDMGFLRSRSCTVTFFIYFL